MMTRRYDMKSRARAADATHRRIIEAAHALLDRPGAGSLSIQEVADAAGVSRATVYNRVGSRRELLAEVFRDQGRLIQFDRVLKAMELEDPAKAAMVTVRESCRAWSVMPGAIRTTLALAAIDQEIGALVNQYEGFRREELRRLARRARRAGVLKEVLTIEQATATLAVLTGFPAYDQLRLDHNVRDATDHLVRMTVSALGLRRDQE